MAFVTRNHVEATGKPFFTGHRWIGGFPSSRILLSRNRCYEFGFPVRKGEEPAAYRYTVNGPDKQKYVPLYDRTDAPINPEFLYPKEMYEIQKGD